MKSLIYGTVVLQSLVSAIAVPASKPEAAEVSAPLEERTFGLWNPGYKPYKYQFYCPGKPVHQKYLCEKPSYEPEYPSYLGYKDDKQDDYQFYLYPGYGNNYGYKEYKDGKTPSPYAKDICLAGEQGYEYITPVYNPPEYKFPDKWVYKYKQWYVSPLYKILAWLEIKKDYFKQYHYWQPPQGYKWICYEDGKGGYDVKAWDGKYKVEKVYFEIQIVVEAQYKKWGFGWF